MKICMVGAGRMAEVHSNNLSKIPGVTLDVVVGVDCHATQAFAENFGYRSISFNLAEALNHSTSDLVVVCTPNQFHAEQTVEALLAERHVICEIPLTMSYTDALEIRELSHKVHRQVLVCHTERFEAGRVELKKRIVAGELHPYHVIARYHGLRRGCLQTALDREGWIDNLLWHHGCHAIDGVLNLTGTPEIDELHVQFGPTWPDLDLPIDIDLQWHTTEGTLINVSLSHNAHWAVHDFTLICQEDTLVSERGTLRNKSGCIVVNESAPDRTYQQDYEFVRSIQEKRESELCVNNILPVMNLLQRAWSRYQKEDR